MHTTHSVNGTRVHDPFHAQISPLFTLGNLTTGDEPVSLSWEQRRIRPTPRGLSLVTGLAVTMGTWCQDAGIVRPGPGDGRLSPRAWLICMAR
jgi:hypothetical protein